MDYKIAFFVIIDCDFYNDFLFGDKKLSKWGLILAEFLIY